MHLPILAPVLSRITAVAVVIAGLARAQASPPTLQELSDENRALRAQVDAQQKLIEQLEARMDSLEKSQSAPLAAGAPASPSPAPADAPAPAYAPSSATGEGGPALRISGEAGLAYFQTGSDGAYPKGEFRVDEARLYLDAPVWASAYFHAELDPAYREATGGGVSVGPLFAEVEDLPYGLNLRAGRIDIPFGEEYQYRTVIDNPLIAHSVSDLWGFDEGAEFFGGANGFSFAGAILDGSLASLSRSHSSFSVAARVGYDPNAHWGVSASALRTGWLDGAPSELSALWFGGGFFIGLPAATEYNADLAEFDAHAAWGGTRLRGAVGAAWYRDNGPASNRRRFTYGYVEAVQPLFGSLSAALRWSAISVPGGYPLVGQGTAGDYLFGDVLTTRLERLSLGLDYRFSDPLLWKIDYSPEWGSTTNDGNRDTEQFFATELGVKF